MTLTLNCTRSIRTALIIGGLCAGFGSGSAFADDAAPAATSSSMAIAVSDATITTELKTRLMRMKGLSSTDIQIVTTDGTVELSGTVRSPHAKAMALAAARNIDGVRHVTDSLAISPSRTPARQAAAKSEMTTADSWITSKVKSELMADSVTKDFAVNVATQDGVVTLEARLDSEGAIKRVKDLAESVRGVKYLDISALQLSAQQ
ncbi:BON domain-containing protein [Paludibacterium yongneupense]|uniref:BON domain-containing protein n=1 Tax=Paludibacterium yongneupense TaxID=400061 RepID=UPI00042A410E|nr:BON domain-containing protein [Paludibacterium yongneupense]